MPYSYTKTAFGHGAVKVEMSSFLALEFALFPTDETDPVESIWSRRAFKTSFSVLKAILSSFKPPFSTRSLLISTDWRTGSWLAALINLQSG